MITDAPSQIPVWVYQRRREHFFPRRQVDPERGKPGPLLDLSNYRRGWWWSGWCVCVNCNRFLVAILPLDGKTTPPPKAIACPMCQALDGQVPEAHWVAAGRVHCGACDVAWIEVYLDEVDILPERVPCRKCNEPTGDITEWPR